jgi:toxin ParE1/3/4
LQFTLQTWVEEQSEEYAADLDAGIHRLAPFPDLGKELGLRRPGLRSFRVRRHMILYRADSDTLTVLPVVHARMDLSRVVADE